MFTSVTKGVNQLHRVALNQALHRQNSNLASIQNAPNVTIIVGTKNVILNIIMAIFSRDFIIIYLTGLGRLYTDYGFTGRFIFLVMMFLVGLRRRREFIVENSYDRRVLERSTNRRVNQINGSGFNPPLYKFKKKSSSSSGKVVGHMSRFGQSKCTDEIIKIINTLPSDYKIIIAGKDIIGGQYSDQFYQIAQTHPNVEMLGFLETPEDVSKFFNKIDVFLYPSIREGLPITLLESIYHQVPFLTTNVAGCIDISNRFGFPACAPEDFGDQDNHLNIENWGNWSPRWKTILTEYSVSKVEAQFENIFGTIIQKHHEEHSS